METYKQLKERQQQESNAFPFGFAFSNEQFDDMMKKLPLDEGDKYYSLGAGAFVRGKDIPAMTEMFKRHNAELKELRQHTKELKKAILSELYNHEWEYSEDLDSVLDAVGISQEDFAENEDLKKAFKSALRQYYKELKLL